MKITAALMLAASLVVAACQTNPSQEVAPAAPPKASLQFVDLQGFDSDLTRSLSAPLPSVDVAFYDAVTPSNLPERVQKWMAAVEAGGGKVQVVPPKSTVTSKNPFLLISIATTMWSASKMAREAVADAQLHAARSYDADIILKVDDKGETVVDKVVFAKKK